MSHVLLLLQEKKEKYAKQVFERTRQKDERPARYTHMKVNKESADRKALVGVWPLTCNIQVPPLSRE